jgi:hypothetical protein
MIPTTYQTILSNEIEAVIKYLSIKQNPGLDGFTAQFYQATKRRADTNAS